mgnify:FL=1
MKLNRIKLRRLIEASIAENHPEAGSRAETEMIANLPPDDVKGGVEYGSQAALEQLIERLKLSYDLSNMTAFGIVMMKIGDNLLELVLNGDIDKAVQVFKKEYDKI